jgi:hypothetical protein
MHGSFSGRWSAALDEFLSKCIRDIVFHAAHLIYVVFILLCKRELLAAELVVNLGHFIRMRFQQT